MNEITLNKSAIERIEEIKLKQNNPAKFLRISVSGGGCSGFQYIFDLDDKILDDDIKISEINSAIFAVTDPVSLQFLQGSVIEFVKELGASYFKVTNPNASANCGCGSSFSV